MQIEITGLHIDTSDAFRTFINDGITHLAKKHDLHIINVSVCSSKDVHIAREKHLFRTDITVHFGQGLDVLGHGVGGDARTSVTQALHHIESRIVRRKKRLIHDKRHQGSIRKVDAQQYIVSPLQEEPAEADAEAAPATIAEMPTEIWTLTPRQAVLRLELSQDQAILFRNTLSGQYNMVYQRKDGNIGWVIPPTEME